MQKEKRIRSTLSTDQLSGSTLSLDNLLREPWNPKDRIATYAVVTDEEGGRAWKEMWNSQLEDAERGERKKEEEEKKKGGGGGGG